jgi:hypothetical protein
MSELIVILTKYGDINMRNRDEANGFAGVTSTLNVDVTTDTTT